MKAERSLLAILNYVPSYFDTHIQNVITPQMFSDPLMSEMAELMFGQIIKSGSIDIGLLIDRLTVKHPDASSQDIITLLSDVPDGNHIDDFITVIKDNYLKTNFNSIFQDALMDLGTGADPLSVLDEVTSRTQKIYESSEKEQINIGPIAEITVDNLYDALAGRSDVGIDSGLPVMDRATGGLKKGDQVILAARPAMGKTSLSLYMALASARTGARVLYISLEMSQQQVSQKLLSLISGIEYSKLRNGDLTIPEMELIEKAKDELSELNIKISSKDQSISQIENRIKSINRRNGLDIVLIDYLQLIYSKGGNRNYEVENCSRRLKGCALNCNLTTIVLSQLSREAANGGEPQLHHLRDSGSIEQDADLVLMLHRPTYYDDQNSDTSCHIFARKNRHGETFKLQREFAGGHFKPYSSMPF